MASAYGFPYDPRMASFSNKIIPHRPRSAWEDFGYFSHFCHFGNFVILVILIIFVIFVILVILVILSFWSFWSFCHFGHLVTGGHGAMGPQMWEDMGAIDVGGHGGHRDKISRDIVFVIFMTKVCRDLGRTWGHRCGRTWGPQRQNISGYCFFHFHDKSMQGSREDMGPQIGRTRGPQISGHRGEKRGSDTHYRRVE